MKKACIILVCGLAYGQTAFDAASVKPAAPLARPVRPSGGPGTGDPGRIHYPGTTLQTLLMAAYDVNVFQIAGPAWLDSEKFDVDATMPPNTANEQFRLMLQHLLAERFRLAMHRETKETGGYALVAGKKGPKLKESAGAALPPADDGSRPDLKLGGDGYFVPPPRAGVFFQMSRPPAGRSTFQQVTMQDLAKALQAQLKLPVTDATGLTTKYDFALDYSTEGLYLGNGRIPVSPGSEAAAPPDIFAALQEQLGLKLESKKISVPLIVIDHAEKIPTGN